MTSIEMRPLARRALWWIGGVLLLLIGGAATLMGLLMVKTTDGQVWVCFGLLCLVGGLVGLASEAVRTQPRPRPRLGHNDGEAALILPRASGPTVVSSVGLVGLGAVGALATVLAALAGAWGGVVLLLPVVALFLWSSGLPGGLAAGQVIFTPTRLIDDYRGAHVEIPWDDIQAVHATHPVLITVRPDRLPSATRSRWRTWRAVSGGGQVRIDASDVAGGPVLVSYIGSKVLLDREFRAALGSEASLPPAPN